MSLNTIALRYARALADVSIERGEVNEVKAELENFSKLFGAHQELRNVLASPAVTIERKQAVLRSLLDRLQLLPTTSNFLKILLANHRLPLIEQVIHHFARELDARSGVVSAVITTARPVTEDESAKLHARLRAATGKEVRLQFKSDPAIIGGIVTRIDSLVYDGSVRTQLQQIREQLRPTGRH